MQRLLFPAATVVMGLLFAFSAILQLNDPDPWLWTAYYFAASIVSFTAVRWRHPGPPGVMAVVAAVWIAVIISGGLPDEPHPMKYGPQSGWLADEVVREGGGLAIVLAWMGVLAWRGRTGGSLETA